MEKKVLIGNIKGPAGADGKSAYAYAVEGGYTSTDAEFAAKLAAEIPTVDSTLSQTGQAADAKATGDAIRSLSEEIDNLPSSGGMSANARNLLISILKSGLYEEDQTDNILALEAALAATGSGGTVETPVDGVTQNGNILSVVSGVTVSQTDAMLLIA